MPITKDGEVTQFQLEADALFVKQAKTLGEFVFCGDTNAPRGKEAFDLIAKEFKDNIPTKYTSSLDPLLHRVKGLNYMIDCLFTTSGYIATDVKLKDGVSDHMAVVAEIKVLNQEKKIS